MTAISKRRREFKLSNGETISGYGSLEDAEDLVKWQRMSDSAREILLRMGSVDKNKRLYLSNECVSALRTQLRNSDRIINRSCKRFGWES